MRKDSPRMKHSLILLGCLVLILGGCAVQQPLSPIIVEEPQIRVGIVWGIPSIDFTADTDFRITNHDGSFIARGLKGSLWRAEVETSSPADINYILVAASMSTEERARDHARDLKKQGFDTVIQPIGQQTRINGRVVNDNRKYRVCLKKAFHSEEAARRYQETIQDRLTTFVTTYKRRAAQGTIKLKNVLTARLTSLSGDFPPKSRFPITDSISSKNKMTLSEYCFAYSKTLNTF